MIRNRGKVKKSAGLNQHASQFKNSSKTKAVH